MSTSAEDHARMEEDLCTTHTALTEAQAQVAAAQEATTAAETARNALQAQIDQAAAAAGQAPGPLADQVNMGLIPRPTGSGWSIRESMQVTKAEYGEIQVRTLHSQPSAANHTPAIAHDPQSCHPCYPRLDRGFPPSRS